MLPSTRPLRCPRHACRIAILALLLLPLLAPLATGATNETTDTRLVDMRQRIQDTQVLVDKETNSLVRAAMDKRLALMVQDLANLERRVALEKRERSLAERQKANPAAVLKDYILTVKGDEAGPQKRAKDLEDESLSLHDDRVKMLRRLSQLRSSSQADPRDIADLDLTLRNVDEQVLLVMLQGDLADLQVTLFMEAKRIGEKVDSFDARPKPTIKLLAEKTRYLADEEKRLRTAGLRVQAMDERRTDVTAALTLARAKATQLTEAVSIRKEKDRMDRSRQRLLAWMFSTDEEKERRLQQERIDTHVAQLQAIQEGTQAATQVSELYDREVAFLKTDLADLKKHYMESIMIPALCILGIILLHLLLTRAIFPLIYKRDRLFVARRMSGYLAALWVIIVIIGFFLEDLKGIATVLGIAGAALVIALQDLCSSFAGWFVIVASRKIRVGDRVEIGGSRGDVIDIQLLRTTLIELHDWLGVDEPTGRIVIIPNSFIFKDKVLNYTHVHPFVWSRLNITVTFETPPKEAREALWEILETETREEFAEMAQGEGRMERLYGVPDAACKPRIFSSIDDSGVTFGMLYATHYRRRLAMRNRLNDRILDLFDKNKRLQFAYPTTRQIPTPESGGFHVRMESAKP
jgi:small-conductance mechanosensitive channel